MHHITPVESARSEAEAERLCFAESNLQVLCFDCHAAIHKSMRMSVTQVHQEREEERTERFIEMFGPLKEGGWV